GTKVLGIVEDTATRVAAGARPRYHVEAVTQATQVVNLPGQTFCSANGTSLDRIELLGLSRAFEGSTASLATPAGYVAETFSVAPALSLALATHGSVLPTVFTSGKVSADHVKVASGEALADYVG